MPSTGQQAKASPGKAERAKQLLAEVRKHSEASADSGTLTYRTAITFSENGGESHSSSCSAEVS